MGELLVDMNKHKGGRSAENWSYLGTGLKELGIGKNQFPTQIQLLDLFAQLRFNPCIQTFN